MKYGLGQSSVAGRATTNHQLDSYPVILTFHFIDSEADEFYAK